MIPYRDLSEADYAAVLESIGPLRPLAQAIAGWDLAASQGVLFDDRRELSRLIGRATTPVAAAVSSALRALPR